jgi:DUF1680 family protein
MREETPSPVQGRSIEAVSFREVVLDDDFWQPRLETNRTTTLVHDLEHLDEQGSLDGFAILAGQSPRKYRGYIWGDSDVYKTLEGMAYIVSAYPDPAMEKRMEQIVATIVRAQAQDGYLMPHIQLAEPEYEHFSEEFTRTVELYSMGHMIESAVAHFETTGRSDYLNAAVKLADLILREYGPGGREQPSGHPEIELALVRLYRVTDNRAYLDLAARMVERSQHVATPWSQGKPSLSHAKNVGHVVATLYLYAGTIDVAEHTGNESLKTLMRRKWEDLVGCKMYLTGNAGHSGHTEGFPPDYVLPNREAYCETCAAIASVMFHHRMFLMDGNSRYIDVLERTLYNGLLSGVAMTGDRFFYPNPLESTGQERSPWFGCPCCPTNVVRFLPQVPGLVYARKGHDIYVNLFVGSRAKIDLDGNEVRLVQRTDYPWNGTVNITVEPEKTEEFSISLRIPGWARGCAVPSSLYRYIGDTPPFRVSLNGESVHSDIADNGYLSIRRSWRKGDRVELDLPMPIRRVLSNENVKANEGRVAVERGPVVYCVEGVDHNGKVMNLYLPDEAVLSADHRPALLGGITVLTTQARKVDHESEGAIVERPVDLTLIPYHAWCHRGAGEMQVWIARTKDRTGIPRGQ